MKNLSLQGVIHAFEQGKFASTMRVAALAVLVLALALVYLFVKFKGFAEPDAMDQGQIARAIASGQGFSTQYIRPLALWQLGVAGKEIPKDAFPDFTHQPLAPLLNAIPLWIDKSNWKIGPLELIYSGERVIVMLSLAFFLASGVVWYLVGRRLFDEKIALLGLAGMFLCDLLWQFSLSGLPHMLMLFLFSLVCWLSLLADESYREGKWRAFLFQILGAAAGLGLMTQSHGLGFWFFLGWLGFAAWLFRKKWLVVLLAAALFFTLQLPWAVRNYQVCGNPFGLSVYTLLWSDDKSDSLMMRTTEPGFRAQLGSIRSHVRAGISEQMTNLAPFLGLNIAALLFFLSLLHRFKSESAARFRWWLLAIWGFATLGMVLFGVRGSPVSMNQLQVLFIPAMSFFGFAFLMVLWGRLGISEPIFRRIFLSAVLFISAVPLIFTMFFSSGGRIQWPPYLPPFIAVFEKWFEPDEVMCSDMPWAVAWYANRKCVLLPTTPRILTRINDYRVLGGPVSGLYLTPITANAPLMSGIYKGEYKEWAGLITRPPITTGFFLPLAVPLPVDTECILFTDRDRWSASNAN